MSLSGGIDLKSLLKSHSLGSWIQSAVVVLGVLFLILKPATDHARIEGQMAEKVDELTKQRVELSRQLTDNAKTLARIEGALRTELGEIRMEIHTVRTNAAMARGEIMSAHNLQVSKIENQRRTLGKLDNAVRFLQRRGDLLVSYHPEAP